MYIYGSDSVYTRMTDKTNDLQICSVVVPYIPYREIDILRREVLVYSNAFLIRIDILYDFIQIHIIHILSNLTLLSIIAFYTITFFYK